LPPAAPDCLQALITVQSLIDCEPMATMTIRNIDDQLKARLRVRAAQHGRSIEPLGGVELELPPREPLRTPPDFGV
jgi:hypothetical protein